LEVPAHAEAVIEGIVSKELLEPRLSFGENPGYMNLDDECFPVVHVTAVTHRKNAMFTPVLVGFPPSETNLIQGFCRSAQMYHRLKYEHRLPVEEVYFYQISGGKNFGIIRVVKDASQAAVQQILAVAYKTRGGKYIIAVDYDVDPHDPELIIWALSFSSQPKEDVSVFEGGSTGLDPSAYVGSSAVAEKDSTPRLRNKYSCVLINATRKAPYPPVALPRREYMERALQIWQSQGDLPAPKLRDPWFGYNLGHWNDTLEEYAQLITKGKYKEVGEKAIHLQKRIS
jgi:4-hydroxy-3-polyprenylbenzoate decarboxylase